MKFLRQIINDKRRIFCLIFAFCFLFIQAHSYLQFTLHRSRQTQQKSQFGKQDDCITKKNQPQKSKQDEDNVEYHELCYYKDISYSIELYQNNKLHHIAIDLTSPYSWLKSDICTVVETGQKCGLTEDSEGRKSSKKRKKNEIKIQQDENLSISDKSKTNNNIDQDSDQEDRNSNENHKTKNQLARIQGSNQFVEGFLQQNKKIEFWTKDSGRLSRLLDILMLGFYVIEQKQKVALERINFINTTKLSQNMDRLCDGALSLRFDENSQNSFLHEIFEYTQTADKMITIYINGPESTLTIGELSIKNTAQGYSGIVWVPVDKEEETTAYGKLPLVKSIVLQSLAKDQQQDIEKDQDNSIFVVFSLSASYIGLPQRAMNQLSKQFNQKYKLDCTVSQHSYFECTSTHSKQSLTQNLLILLKQGAISLPFQSLILKQAKKKITFNMRLISKEQNEEQKSFIILGEPFFQKYFTALDYRANRIGFAVKRTAEHNNFISTVSLIRFVSLLFFTGCCFLICFQPLKKFFEAFTGTKRFYEKKSPQGRRLKYEAIQENPYEEVAGTLRRVIEQNDLN